MTRRRSRNQKLMTAKNAEFTIPYGHYSETPMMDVPEIRAMAQAEDDD